MTRDDILTLARAGFSAAQIAALGSIQPAAPAAAAPAAPAAPSAPAAAAPAAAAPAAAAPAAAAPAAAAPATAAPDPVQQLLTQMGALTQAVQANALLSAQQPKPQSADDILAEIIAPPRKEDNK